MIGAVDAIRAGAGWGGLPRYPIVLGLGLLAGCGFILALSLLTGGSGRASEFWLGTGDTVFPYPFTIQNNEHLLFFLAMADLYVRWGGAKRELSFLKKGYLPEDAETVLTLDNLGPLRREVADDFDGDNGFLPYLIDLSVLQVQASRSVDQTVSVLNSTLELIAHKVDLRYTTKKVLKATQGRGGCGQAPGRRPEQHVRTVSYACLPQTADCISRQRRPCNGPSSTGVRCRNDRDGSKDASRARPPGWNSAGPV